MAVVASVLFLDSLVQLGAGLALLVWPRESRGFLFGPADPAASNHTVPHLHRSQGSPDSSAQADIGVRFAGAVLVAVAVFLIAVWLLAGRSSSTKATAASPERQLLNVAFVFVPGVWIAVIVVVLSDTEAFTEDGLFGLIGGAFSLAIVNLLVLMANCWPSAPAPAPTRETTAAARAHDKSGPAGAVQDGGGDDELTPLIDNAGLGPAAPAAPARAGADGSGAGWAPDTTAIGIAKASTEARAAKEEDERKNRERGYGTLKLLQLARPHKGWLYAGCAVLLLRLPFSLSIPHWVAETIGALIDKDYDTARWNVAYLTICGTCDALLDFWCVYLFGLAQQKIIRSLRVDLFAAILKQEVGFFDTTKIGEITSRLTADTAEMANDLTWVFRFTIEAFVRIGGILAYMMLRSWRLGTMALAIIPVTATINRYYATWMHENQKQVQTALADANTVAEEVISSIRTVFSFAMEPGEHRRYQQNIQRYYVLVVKQVFVQGVYYMVCNTFLINTCVQAALLLYGTFLVSDPDTQLHPKVLLAFMLYQGQLQEYFQNLLNSFTSLIKSSGAAAKVFEFIDRKPCYRSEDPRFAIAPADSPAVAPEDEAPPAQNIYEDAPLPDALMRDSFKPMSVTLQDVHFCYPARPDVLVLDGLSLTASPGQVVALVGSSGSGKSTSFHLIEHFYEAQLGTVLIDGRDVTTLDHEWLHQRVALVGQEPTLLSGSIADNIMYGLTEKVGPGQQKLLHDRMVQAATEANAHAFIMALPDRYDTQVGERGVQLSGGQKQRIAIARCLIRNPAVLLLDEATSALDAESESVVQEALERAMKNRTTLLIAHRLSTVKNANRIIMIHKGRVIESGTHEELMANTSDVDGISYRALVHRQTLQ